MRSLHYKHYFGASKTSLRLDRPEMIEVPDNSEHICQQGKRDPRGGDRRSEMSLLEIILQCGRVETIQLLSALNCP